MNRLFIGIYLASYVCVAQSQDSVKYNVRSVIDANKNSKVHNGTQDIVDGIRQAYAGKFQQQELIRFYLEAYDYKVVDRHLLNNLIDSLTTYGVDDSVRESATQAKEAVMHRFLGKQMRNFELPDKDGNLITLYSIQSRFTVVELWATWCSPCRVEMDRIPEIRAMKNIEFYSISLDKTPREMLRYIIKKEYDWPIVFGGYQDANPDLWEYLHIVAVPKYYVLNNDKTVIKVLDKLEKDTFEALLQTEN